MHDIKFIRENAEAVKRAAVDNRITYDADEAGLLVDQLLAVDKRRRELQVELEAFA